MEEIDNIIAAAEEEAPEIPDEEENVYSWTFEDNAAIKQADRHVFLFRETIVPPGIREFFGAEDLQPGKKKRVVLWHGESRFDAFIEKTLHRVPKIRMIWKQDLAAVFWKEYPQWLEFFKKNRTESGDTPFIRFTKRPEPGHYNLELEGVIPQEVTGDFHVPWKAGDTIDNNALRSVFRCSLLGTMRQSLATNSLVLIADHAKPGCEDKWIGKVFHFTGMGTVGERGIGSRQNVTLAKSRENGIRLFLFEVFYEGTYVYIGEVELMDRPYRSRQVDSEKNMRDVPVFPLQLVSHKNPPLITPEPPGAGREPAPETVRTASPGTAGSPAAKTAGGSMSSAGAAPAGRDAVGEEALRHANGLCQLCGLPAPFTGHDGQPYLELHHIVPLDEGGLHAAGNLAALCPNCHRKMHVLNLQADVTRLGNRVLPDPE
jgi:5-methylcytosine-specific restriction protein A